MKACIIFMGAMMAALTAISQDPPLIWRGSVESDQRLLLKEDQAWAWNETRLDLTLEKRARPVRIVGNIWLRHLGPSITGSTEDLIDKDMINPWSLNIRELYAQVHGFLWDDLDLSLGRQQISWGTADQFNPTNSLNPYDLEDILDFGRNMGVDALNLHWHLSFTSSLQAVFVPRFQPSGMPAGPFFDLPDTSFDWAAGLPLPDLATSLTMPANNLREGSSVGLRWRGFMRGYDFSLSYVYGRDPLPLPTKIEIQVDEATGDMLPKAFLAYPRHHVAGADMAGSIGRVGVWGEVAVFFPTKEIRMDIDLPPVQLPLPLPDHEVILGKSPYAKFVVGSDYTFTSGTYLNVQYVRGFLHERGKDQLNDYLFLKAERNVLDYRLKVQPLAGGVSVTDWGDVSGHYAIFYTPAITYQGIDNLEISLGGFLFGGKGDNLFAGLKDHNMVRLHLKASF